MSPLRTRPVRWIAGGVLAVSLVAAAASMPGSTGTNGSVAFAQAEMPEQDVVRPVAQLSAAFIAISDAVMPSIVRIESRYAPEERVHEAPSRGMRDFRDVPGHRDIPRTSGGTGFIVRGDGYIVTNAHVVQGADHIEVTLYDKHRYAAEVVGLDPSTDVALLRIPADNLPALRLGDSDEARVGEWVLAVGNPGFGGASTLDFTVTSGIISAKGRPLQILADVVETEDGLASFAIEDFIQTDAVINPGNSGGPLVNLRGEVIGINTAIASGTGFYQGYGFAVPMNLARRVVSDLLEHGRVRRALLGVSISDVTAEDAEAFGLPTIAGASVEDFATGSPAERAGLEIGDVIVSVDGRPVTRVGELQRRIADYEPEARVRVGVIRYGEPHEVTVQLTEAPLSAPMLPRPSLASRETDLGIRVGDAGRRVVGKSTNTRTAGGGVVIESVLPGSPADRARIVPDLRIVAINRRPVSSASEARELLDRARSGEVVSLLLSTEDGRTSIANIRKP